MKVTLVLKLLACLTLAIWAANCGDDVSPPPSAPTALERAVELKSTGVSACAAAQTLVEEFDLQEAECASVMYEGGYTAGEVGEALHDFFNLDPPDTAEILAENLDLANDVAMSILSDLGCSVQEMFDAARIGLGMSDIREIEDIFETLGCAENDFLEITAVPTVERFAPMLGFDRAADDFPMSANKYFTTMMTWELNDNLMTMWYVAPWDGPPLDPAAGIVEVCGRDECNNGMSNSDFGLLTSGNVPTYYRVVRGASTKRLRIAYWWFYGFQRPCGSPPPFDDGAHHGDWERIVVTTNSARDAIESVTFFQHGGHYTRQPGGFEPYNGRPKVYVGKIAHGSYHNGCDAPECSDAFPGLMCRYYGDFRNPNVDDWWDTAMNLKSLGMRDISERWMAADEIGSVASNGYTITAWYWGPHISYLDYLARWVHKDACGTHPTTYGDVYLWNLPSCDDDGCSRDQGWP